MPDTQIEPTCRVTVTILHNGYAAAPLHGRQAGGAVSQRARENNADNAGAIRERGRTKERVDSRPAVVLSGPTYDGSLSVFEQQVKIRRRDIDAAGLDCLAVTGVSGRKRPGAGKELWQYACTLGRKVDDHEQCRR